MSARLIQACAAAMLLQVTMVTAPLADGFAGLGEEASGFAEVVPGRAITIPRDFGRHDDFRIEWWYLTANLHDSSDASFGVQWTLFRNALVAGPARDGFASPHVWMGHAAVTSRTAHLFSETLARGGIGQAGVNAEPFRAWIDDWTFAADGEKPGRATLRASGERFGYALELASDRPIVLHGDQGFSRKSSSGQASYYFSQPFYDVHGTLTLDGRDIAVSGQAWMDREWSSQPLAASQKGWDWFSLHLASGEKVMLFRLRSKSGSDYLSGTWIAADGTATRLDQNDVALTSLASTVITDRTLPTRWSVHIKSRGLEIETAPLNPNSWMGTSIPYWEGPIIVSGSHTGEGYLEMTGY